LGSACFKGIKAKIGYPDVKEGIEVIRAMRAAGEDVAIMVDYNQSFTPVEAMWRLRELDKEGLTWVEGHAWVAREASVPIQCGENWWGAPDLRHAIDARTCDYVMLDAMKIDGISGWMRSGFSAGNTRHSSLKPSLAGSKLAVALCHADGPRAGICRLPAREKCRSATVVARFRIRRPPFPLS
jgi:mandelate racemase